MAAADLLMHLDGHLNVRQLRIVGDPYESPSPASSPSSILMQRHLQQQQPLHGGATAAEEKDVVLELRSTPTLELVSALWSAHSSLPGGAFQPTRGLMTVLPGLLHNAAVMYAYPMAQLVAAAVWERCFAEESGDGTGGVMESAESVRGGEVLRRVLLQEGDPGGAATALEALLGQGCVRRVWVGHEDVERQPGSGGAEVGAVDPLGSSLEERGWTGKEMGEEIGLGGGEWGVTLDLAHESFQGVDPLVF